MMAKIRMIEKFQKFFVGLFQKKYEEVPQEVVSALEKNMERNKSGYKSTGKPLRISYLDRDGKTITLSDGSSWAVAPCLGLDQNHALYWSPMDSIQVMPKGNVSGNIFTLINLGMGERSRWVFQGYAENRGES